MYICLSTAHVPNSVPTYVPIPVSTYTYACTWTFAYMSCIYNHTVHV